MSLSALNTLTRLPNKVTVELCIITVVPVMRAFLA